MATTMGMRPTNEDDPAAHPRGDRGARRPRDAGIAPAGARRSLRRTAAALARAGRRACDARLPAAAGRAHARPARTAAGPPRGALAGRTGAAGGGERGEAAPAGRALAA